MFQTQNESKFLPGYWAIFLNCKESCLFASLWDWNSNILSVPKESIIGLTAKVVKIALDFYWLQLIMAKRIMHFGSKVLWNIWMIIHSWYIFYLNDGSCSSWMHDICILAVRIFYYNYVLWISRIPYPHAFSVEYN